MAATLRFHCNPVVVHASFRCCCRASRVLPRNSPAVLRRERRARAVPSRSHGLTERELDVLELITQGHTNDEIAKRLFLSINSVKSYIRTSYRKMGVTSRTNAVLWGLEHGFVPDRMRARAGD